MSATDVQLVPKVIIPKIWWIPFFLKGTPSTAWFGKPTATFDPVVQFVGLESALPSPHMFNCTPAKSWFQEPQKTLQAPRLQGPDNMSWIPGPSVWVSNFSPWVCFWWLRGPNFTPLEDSGMSWICHEYVMNLHKRKFRRWTFLDQTWPLRGFSFCLHHQFTDFIPELFFATGTYLSRQCLSDIKIFYWYWASLKNSWSLRGITLFSTFAVAELEKCLPKNGSFWTFRAWKVIEVHCPISKFMFRSSMAICDQTILTSLIVLSKDFPHKSPYAKNELHWIHKEGIRIHKLVLILIKLSMLRNRLCHLATCSS